MIVDHATGTQVTLAQIRRQFTGIAQTADPAQGIRTPWADESNPTDSELRVLGYSYRADTPRPVNTVAAPDALIDDVWTQQWAPIPDADVRARITAEIGATADAHILATLPISVSLYRLGRAQQITRIETPRQTPGGPPARALTPAEQAEIAEGEALLAWSMSVRTAAAAEQAAVASMTRAQLDAWTMPPLPPRQG